MSSGIMQHTNIPNSDLRDAVSPNSVVNLVWLAPFLLALAWFWANISAVKWLLSSFVEIPTLYKIVIGFLIVALVVRSIGNSVSAALEEDRPPGFSPNFVLRRYPLLLMLGAGICSIALQYIIDIQQVTPAIYPRNLRAVRLIGRAELLAKKLASCGLAGLYFTIQQSV